METRSSGASPCHLTRLRRLDIDLGSLADFVGAAPDDRVSILQRTEHLDELADARAATHIHPLRHTIVDADHERALRRGDDAGRRHEERGLRPPHWPLHFGMTPSKGALSVRYCARSLTDWTCACAALIESSYERTSACAASAVFCATTTSFSATTPGVVEAAFRRS